MAEENKNEKKRSRGGRLLALMLTSPVNTLFILALAYYAFQIYVLNNSPLLNKAIMLGIACLWILWFAAKNLIKLLLLLILAGTAVYGYYGYATRDVRKCEENGGVWNKESKTCEEKTGWLHEIQKLVEQYLKNKLPTRFRIGNSLQQGQNGFAGTVPETLFEFVAAFVFFDFRIFLGLGGYFFLVFKVIFAAALLAVGILIMPTVNFLQQFGIFFLEAAAPFIIAAANGFAVFLTIFPVAAAADNPLIIFLFLRHLPPVFSSIGRRFFRIFGTQALHAQSAFSRSSAFFSSDSDAR